MADKPFLQGFVFTLNHVFTALACYALDWNGLIKIEIMAIMDDDTVGGVFGKKFG